MDDSVVYFAYIRLLIEEIFKDKEPEMFAILGSHNVFSEDCTYTRITIPSLESGMFSSNHGNVSVQK